MSTAEATTTPNSLNKLPVKPCKNMTGKNTTASVIEVEITAKNISLLPSNAALFMVSPSSIFLKIFSVTTIPSSTTRPVANTMPKSVSTLIEKPAMYIIKNVATSEIGMSINGLMAMAQFLKNTKMTSITRQKEMPSVSFTSCSERLTVFVLSINTLN